MVKYRYASFSSHSVLLIVLNSPCNTLITQFQRKIGNFTTVDDIAKCEYS